MLLPPPQRIGAESAAPFHLSLRHFNSSQAMHIRRLMPADASVFQSLWLFALLESPAAFDASYGEEQALPLTAIAHRLSLQPDRGVFGAFDGEDLIGIVTLDRENLSKLAHKANVRNLYIGPQSRRRGVARALLLEALSLAESVRGIQQVNLAVHADARHAVRFFGSIGFVVFGRERGAVCTGGRPHDKLHMALHLAKAGSVRELATRQEEASAPRRMRSLYLVCSNPHGNPLAQNATQESSA
jgi:ribosomal protein S18 acetylase RimI-like enzyme